MKRNYPARALPHYNSGARQQFSHRILKLWIAIAAIGLSMLQPLTSDAQYCTSGFFSSTCGVWGDCIWSFSTNGGSTNISNINSSCTPNAGSYEYFSTKKHTAPVSATVSFTLENTPVDNEYHKIYVDWNQDSDFNDPGEEVYSGYLSPSQVVNGSFTVPSTATPGVTRLRVFCNYGSYPSNACTGSTWGEVEDYDFEVLSPCTPPSNLLANIIGSTRVEFSWVGVTGSMGYEYAVTSSATPPATGTPTMNTNAVVNNLTPSIAYYIHVRNECANYPSAWITRPFTTLPPCTEPAGFSVTSINQDMATFNWWSVPTAIEYQYIVDNVTTAPLSTQSVSTAMSASGGANGLQANTTYYVHIRTMCQSDDSSGWSLDSFATPKACDAPDVSFAYTNASRVVAYWEKVETAYEYEILLTTTVNANPTTGMRVSKDNVLYSSLDAGTIYYVYAKSYCNDRGMKTESKWSNAAFNTWALSADDLEGVQDNLKVYPNPVHDKITIDMQGAYAQKDANVSIRDISGKLMLQQKISGAVNNIDVHTLPAGMYLLQYVDDHTSKQIKIIKK